MTSVHHRVATVEGLDIFYREAGPADAPVVLALHGYPTSSHMFRHLLPALADRYRVIAPDHVGFGRSSAPTVEDYPYSFDALAESTAAFLAAVGVDTFAVVAQDYGAPIAWRLALRDALTVTAVVSQNGNAYEEGFVPGFWAPVWAYGDDPSAANEQALRPALERDAVMWQYLHGVPDPTLVAPDAWEHDLALLRRPGVDRAQLALFGDYRTNRAVYPDFQRWLRTSGVPVLGRLGEERPDLWTRWGAGVSGGRPPGPGRAARRRALSARVPPGPGPGGAAALARRRAPHRAGPVGPGRAGGRRAAPPVWLPGAGPGRTQW